MLNENNNGQNLPNSTKSYLFFLTGQQISLLGSSIVQFALIWWITITSKSDPYLTNYTGLVLGVAAFLGFGPMVFTFIFSGVLVDRWNRKKVIFSMDFIQAFFSTILMILFFINEANIYFILIVLTLRGFAQGFHTPAVQAIIPLLVPREKLTQINSFENFGNNIINLIGPVIGAVIINLFGVDQIGWIMSFDAITFLIALVPLILIKIPPVTRKEEFIEKPSFKNELFEGISFIKNTRGLLALLTTFTMINLLVTPVNTLLPLVVLGSFTADPELGSAILAFALLFTQAGTILFSIILTKFKPFKENVLGVVSGQSLTYVGFFVFIVSIYTQNQFILYFAMFLYGCSIILANVHSQTIWQSVVPPELQGRVMSVRMVIAWVFVPLSMLLAGALSDLIGYTTLFVACASFGTIYLIGAWLFTGLPRVEEDLGLKMPNKIETSNPIEEQTI